MTTIQYLNVASASQLSADTAEIAVASLDAATKTNCRHSVLRLLLATALPLVLLAEGVAPALAGSVTVTGANGASGCFGPAGPGGSATATTTTPSDPSNTATATGGNGGSASFDLGCYAGIPGGAGGKAYSTATTSISYGAASAEAASFGGLGGNGGYGEGGNPPGPAGAGGPASSTAAASSTTGSASATASSTGGNSGTFRSPGPPGAASAAASASSTGSSAAASANARNSHGTALTTASAPGGTSASALTKAAVGAGAESLVPIMPGQAVSNAILTPGGAAIGVGAMSGGYGGAGQALQYRATAIFDFTTPTSETLYLNLVADNFSGIGFNRLVLKVIVDGTEHAYTFSTLGGSGGAKSFFAAQALDLGAPNAGSQSIKVVYVLDYKSGTSAAASAGFGFTYDLSTTPVAPITWPRP
jgi:hypothetical protein